VCGIAQCSEAWCQYQHRRADVPFLTLLATRVRYLLPVKFSCEELSPGGHTTQSLTAWQPQAESLLLDRVLEERRLFPTVGLPPTHLRSFCTEGGQVGTVRFNIVRR